MRLKGEIGNFLLHVIVFKLQNSYFVAKCKLCIHITMNRVPSVNEKWLNVFLNSAVGEFVFFNTKIDDFGMQNLNKMQKYDIA